MRLKQMTFLLRKIQKPRLMQPFRAMHYKKPFQEWQGFARIDFFEQLVSSLPADSQQDILNELDTAVVIKKAEHLSRALSLDKIQAIDLEDSRTLFLSALQLLRDKRIDVSQLASLHIRDSAIRTIYVNPDISFTQRSLMNSELKERELREKVLFFTLLNLQNLPDSMQCLHYTALPLWDGHMTLPSSGLREDKALMQLFFNFTPDEWLHFCEEMAQAPFSEQYFHTLITHPDAQWSELVHRIQQVLNCMQTQEMVFKTDTGYQKEQVVPVPSFSMYQAAINAKANTLKRDPLQLIPTYGYVHFEHYKKLKCSGKMAFTLYLPEKAPNERYNRKQGGFRTEIDRYPDETSFAGGWHDVYHTMREMSMSENIRRARMRLALIAEQHPMNNFFSKYIHLDRILVDGELIHSFSSSVDTMFNRRKYANSACSSTPLPGDKFGDIFYAAVIKDNLHENLKRAFIEDMVIYREEWQTLYNLGKFDLREEDQGIYEELEYAINNPLLPKNTF